MQGMKVQSLVGELKSHKLVVQQLTLCTAALGPMLHNRRSPQEPQWRHSAAKIKKEEEEDQIQG